MIGDILTAIVLALVIATPPTALVVWLWKLRRQRIQKAHNAAIWDEVVEDARRYHKRYPFTNRDTGGSRHLAGAKRWDEMQREKG